MVGCVGWGGFVLREEEKVGEHERVRLAEIYQELAGEKRVRGQERLRSDPRGRAV